MMIITTYSNIPYMNSMGRKPIEIITDCDCFLVFTSLTVDHVDCSNFKIHILRSLYLNDLLHKTKR